MVRLELLGGATIRKEGAVLARAVARRHPLALLAVAAASAPSPVGRSKVAGLLWPDVTEGKARRRLNACLHRVRKQVGEEAVLSVGDGIQLNEKALRSDVTEFDRALREGHHEEAVRLWRGPFLDGFHLDGTPEFEHWVDRQRDRLRDGYRKALEALAEEAERRGDSEAASRWWHQRARDDPCDSRVTLRLMEALVRSGNPAAALRVAEDHTGQLAEEFDTSPPPEIVDLVRTLGEASSHGPPQGMEPGAPDPGTDGESAPETAPLEAPGSGRGLSRPASQPAGVAGSNRRILGTVLAAVLVLAAVVAALALAGDADAPDDGPVDERSVAVLPLTYVGPPGRHEFLAVAMTEEITSALSAVPELVVKSRSSASRFGASGLSVAEFGRVVGVSHVIEGSVQRQGDRFRATVQLIDARSDENVWTESYERELGHLFQVQVEIAERVADRLAATFSDRERARILGRATSDPMVYDLFLQARGTPPGRRIELLRRAVERDSSFWPAWASLVGAYLEIERQGQGAHWADSARQAIGRAIAHADSTQVPRIEAYQALIFGGDTDETLARLRAAVERLPSDVFLVSALGQTYRLRGRLPEAVRWLRWAARLDPLTAGRWQMLFPSYWWAGLYDPAGRVLERATEVDPGADAPWIQFMWHWMIQDRRERSLAAIDSAETRGARNADLFRGFIHWWYGDLSEARRAFESFDPDSVTTVPGVLPIPIAATLYRTGDSARAGQVVERFRQMLESQGLDPYEPEFRVFPRLQLAALDGDVEHATELVRRYVERGGRDYNWFLQSPLFRELRDEPAFQIELSALQRSVEEMAREMKRDLRREDRLRP